VDNPVLDPGLIWEWQYETDAVFPWSSHENPGLTRFIHKVPKRRAGYEDGISIKTYNNNVVCDISASTLLANKFRSS
jgi:hypothetical protein